MGHNSFIFNLEWYAVLSEYPAEVRFEVYEAIMRYAASGTLSDLKPLAHMAFSFIKKELDYNRDKYESMVEKRREAGRLGGATKGISNASASKTSKCKQNKQVLAKQASASYNDNVNDNVNDNDIIKNSDDFVLDDSEEADESTEQMLEQEFESFRKAYPGRKRGFKVELENLKRKYPKTWREITPLLSPALERLIEWHEKSITAGQFTPSYKNLSTWIDRQCWTEELPEVDVNALTPRNNGTTAINHGNTDRQSEFARHIIDKLSTPDSPEPDISGNY